MKDILTTERNIVEEKLAIFDETIDKHDFLDIAGDIEGDNPEKHLIKVVNHNTEEAYTISIDTIVRQRIGSIVRALETGITTRLFGITRIVGYYSRVNNWNKSKRAELADRHKGSYKLPEPNI